MTVELNPQLGFERFLTGSGNGLAATAARKVAEAPGTAYNPLYICGDPGAGKTHLLTASGRMAQLGAPWMTVEYLPLDELAEAHQAANAAGQGEAFQKRLSAIDFLLMDDIQQLSQRLEIQSTVLELVSSMVSAGRQVVVAGTSQPSEIAGVDDDLVVRLSAGLVVDIEPPDYETRLAILERRTKEREVQFNAGVLEAVAEFEIVDIRELLGVQNRLMALQAVGDDMITPKAARALLEAETFPLPATAKQEIDERGEPEERDEFADFLADVSVTVQEQVQVWQSRLGDAIRKWGDEGYVTARLETMLEQDTLVSVEDSVHAFERDVQQLASLRATMVGSDPDAAEDPVFSDPDRVAEAKALVEGLVASDKPADLLSSSWTFQSHVEGLSNRTAREAARAVIVAPGTGHNPLVLAGSTGVGKTHLLHAIGNELSDTLGFPVVCVSTQKLLDDISEALANGKIEHWRSRFQKAMVLLIDDVHLAGSQPRVQAEVVRLLDNFVDSTRQVVVTINALPEEVEGLDDSLRSKLGAGLVVEIGPPDRDLRYAIVSRILTDRLGSADQELTDYLADRPADSIRSVVGLVQRVITSAESGEVTVSAALARELTQGTAAPMRRPSSKTRSSGVLTSPTGGIRSSEKIVWNWPIPEERLIEEFA